MHSCTCVKIQYVELFYKVYDVDKPTQEKFKEAVKHHTEMMSLIGRIQTKEQGCE